MTEERQNELWVKHTVNGPGFKRRVKRNGILGGTWTSDPIAARLYAASGFIVS